jgi:competence protein ComEA
LIDINDASSDDLEKLPGIGPSMAKRIIEHRERFGKFRRLEHLIMVRGFSDRRFRELRPLITAE